MVPTRHAYAALLLAQGHVAKATRVYAEDLGLDDSLTRAHRHSYNACALHGYHQCVLHLGRGGGGMQGPASLNSNLISRRHSLISMFTDFPVQTSCFFRLEDPFSVTLATSDWFL